MAILALPTKVNTWEWLRSLTSGTAAVEGARYGAFPRWPYGPDAPAMLITSEQTLLQRARAGQRDAFDQIFLAHKDGVYACLWHLLDGDADLVEDAVGAVFLSAYRALGRFRGDSAFSTWLYRIAVNEAHGRRRRRQRQREIVPLDDQTMARYAQPNQEDPAHDYARAEEGRALVRAVRALPEPYRTPVTLRYFGGMAASEVAAVLKRPPGTVRYQISRALRMLRERMGSEWSS